MQELKLLSEKVLEIAQKHGASHASATVAASSTSSVARREGKTETLKDASSMQVSLELFVDGRYSSHHTSDIREDALDHFIKQGIELTKLLEVDEFRKLPDPSLYENRADIDLEQWDERIVNMAPQDRIDLSRRLEEAGLSVGGPINTLTASVNTSSIRLAKANTNGFSGETARAYLSAYVSASINDPNGKKPSDGLSFYVCNLDECPNVEEFAQKATRRALGMIGQQKLPSQKTTIVMENSLAAQMIDKWLSPLYGSNIQQKQSYFEGKIGQIVASPLLSITDAPHLRRAANSRLFDSEGISTKERPIILDGKLQCYLLNTYYANKLGLAPTTTGTNQIFKLGSKSEKEIIAGVNNGIFIMDLLGGNSDPVRGDFSYGFIGYAIENGKLTVPVSEMNITGNFNELWQHLVEVGNDPYPYDSVMAPTFCLTDVNVSGT